MLRPIGVELQKSLGAFHTMVASLFFLFCFSEAAKAGRPITLEQAISTIRSLEATRLNYR